MFLDTSGLLVAAWSAEQRHEDAKRLLRSARRLVIHNYVVAEFIALCNVLGASRKLALAFLDGLFTDARVEMRWVDRELHGRGIGFLRKRPDKSYSLTDSISFLMMRTSRIREALTTDGHFEQEGFVCLLKQR